jgi:hypothetical protein
MAAANASRQAEAESVPLRAGRCHAYLIRNASPPTMSLPDKLARSHITFPCRAELL